MGPEKIRPFFGAPRMARSAIAAAFWEVQRTQPWILSDAANQILTGMTMRSG
jgi:hypothetical protein